MKPHLAIGISASLVVLSLAQMPSATADFISRPQHDFECGKDEPPSGPYLDYATGSVMDYDCTTKTLTPEVGVQNTCTFTVTPQGEFVPIYGVCIGMGDVQCDNGPCDDRYKVKTLVAATGQWSYSWETFYEEGEGGFLANCDDAACNGPAWINPCESNSLVTYCEDGRTHVPLCPGHEITVNGKLTTTSGTTQESFDASRTVNICH